MHAQPPLPLAFANTRAAIDSGNIILGAGADLRQHAENRRASSGNADPSAPRTPYFRSAITPVVLAAVKGLGAGTGISNADRDFTSTERQASAGKLDPPLLDIGQRAAEARSNFNGERLIDLCQNPKLIG